MIGSGGDCGKMNAASSVYQLQGECASRVARYFCSDCILAEEHLILSNYQVILMFSPA